MDIAFLSGQLYSYSAPSSCIFYCIRTEVAGRTFASRLLEDPPGTDGKCVGLQDTMY